ncbi:MAG TPA: hypothetical protein DEP18_01150 [Flavobacteriales bacterium]|nr:hypothetical protein [Flavobacteriales bacterium]HCA82363.1 hypothetical protein [Flavobacteriales bacterium]HRE73588.1 DUF4270 domain-containing protein [Flavobacteriales bacterium]HRJ37279.1 DUF4270 domain-containing protein [Flavobacteriales bacterium]
MKLKTTSFSKAQRSFMAAVFFVALSLGACRKSDADLGATVQPADDILNGTVMDTLTLRTFTRVSDSLRTDELANNLIGSINDPVFGKAKAGIFTQIRLAANAPDFTPGDIIIDSLVLSLVYQSYYGKLDAQQFHVYEITDTLYQDSAYYSTTVKQTDPTDLVVGGYSIQTPNTLSWFHDPIIGDSSKPQLRLRLDNSLAQRFANESGNATLADNDNFTRWFKGLHVTVDNSAQAVGNGALMYIDMLDPNTKVTMYYRRISTGDTVRFSFLINDRCARYTRYTHDYSGTEVALQLADSTLGNNYFYLQAGAGLQAEIHIPHLMELNNNGNIIVNLAELILPVQYFNLDPLTPAPQIILFGINDEGESYTVADLFLGDLIFGGYYDASRKVYRFSITRHIQRILNGTHPNKGLRLAVVASSISGNRSILSGAGADNRDKPSLKIIYTKYQ